MAHRFSLDQLKIASPCGMDWNEMQGDDRARFCDSCQKHVYNFAAMTTEEGLALIEAKEGKLCGRLTRRYDGTILTADCPVGLAAKTNRFRRRLVYGAIAAGLYTFSFWWFSTSRLDDPTRSCGDRDALAEKLDEWVDNVREWAGLPPKRTRPAYAGMMLVPMTGKVAPTAEEK